MNAEAAIAGRPIDIDITALLAEKLAGMDAATIPAEAIEVAKQCLVDALGVAIAARREPLVEMLVAELADGGSGGDATVVGRSERLSMIDAALVNGSMAHAIDYDDVNFAMQAHGTVAVAPAVLALGEKIGASGRDVLAALVAGIDLGGRIGLLMQRRTYEHGWHTTGTIGAFGAAAGAAHLLGLSPQATAHALGIAGTQAAGVKAVFGSMSKPFHAGKAAANGLIAARLAARGFTSAADILGHPQGFVAAQSGAGDVAAALADPPGGAHILGTIFKYHAACFFTHAPIEALNALRTEHGLRPDDIVAATIGVDPHGLAVADIQEPRTGLEMKFSLRMTGALALAGENTGDEALFSAATAGRPDLVALRDRIVVEPRQVANETYAEVELRLTDGRVLTGAYDASVPARAAEQWEPLGRKFTDLVAPAVGAARCAELLAALRGLDGAGDISPVMAGLGGAAWS
jgi:2-methylcitrate dehydratase PrpD